MEVTFKRAFITITGNDLIYNNLSGKKVLQKEVDSEIHDTMKTKKQTSDQIPLDSILQEPSSYCTHFQNVSIDRIFICHIKNVLRKLHNTNSCR